MTKAQSVGRTVLSLPKRRANADAATASMPQGTSGNVRELLSPAPDRREPPPSPDLVAAFIELQAEARSANSLDALKFVIVNATRKMAMFDQAFLLVPSGDAGWRVTLASSVAAVDRNASAVRALEAWASRPRSEIEQKLDSLHLVELPVLDGHAAGLRFGLWVPIKSRRGKIISVLLALRRECWAPQHTMLMAPLAGAYGHAWEAIAPARPGPIASIRQAITASRFGLAAAITVCLGLLVPVPLSALAPAEIVAASPTVVSAPIDGVVREIVVPPGTFVEAGAPLIRFVDTKLRNDVEIAGKARAVAEARYFKAMQSALSTQKELEDIAIAQGELAVAAAEHAAAEDLLARSVVKADKPGLLIYSAASDWVGKPVQIGERIMEIGDPANVELRIDLPVSDAVAFKAGGTVSLFLDGDPLRPLGGTIERIGYRPIQSSDQQMIYRIYASLTNQEVKRIGLRGTARVSGETVSLWYYLFRRPLSALRQRIGA